VLLGDAVESETFTQTRRTARCPFLARAKATDVVSGMQIDGLTTHLNGGGCCILTRRAPFPQGTRILLEITKGGVSLRTHAFVVYNLKDQFTGLCFVEMPPSQVAILAGWMKAAMPSLSR
jgi:PilZ domain